MKILLFGKTGQVGWELQRSLAPLGEIVAPRRNDETLPHDLSDLNSLAATIRAIAPDLIINAAAYTAVDKAESDSDLCRTVNRDAPAVLASEAKRSDAWLVHYSTDYVFDGEKDGAYIESDSTAPLSIYGQTKLEGEMALLESGCKHLILRTSWIFSTRRTNFLKTMLRLATEQDRLSVVADQIGAPTGADLVADVTAHAVRSAMGNSELSGLYHLAAGGEASWHEYASYVIEAAREAGTAVRVAKSAVKPVGTADYPRPARRPRNSQLNCQKLEQTFGLKLPHWETGVAHTLSEILREEV